MPERPPAKHRALGDPSEPGTSPPPPLSSSGNAPANGGNVARDLFKNLVEMVPLVESLMDRRANPSFTRRASVVYTPAPSNSKKGADLKGRKSAKKQRDKGDMFSDKITSNLDGIGDCISGFSSRESTTADVPKDTEELTMLREQLDDLHKKLLEKDEALKSAEESMNQMYSVNLMLNELRRQVAEKDSLVENANSQLADTKIKLADKQATLEKLECEAQTSNKKVQELQGDLDSMDFEVAAFKRLFEELSKNDSATYPVDDITSSQHFDHLPPIDDIDEPDLGKMEEARMVYMSALAAAKQNPTEESFAAAAAARLHLRDFVL